MINPCGKISSKSDLKKNFEVQIMRKISSNLMRNYTFSHDIDDFFINFQDKNFIL